MFTIHKYDMNTTNTNIHTGEERICVKSTKSTMNLSMSFLVLQLGASFACDKSPRGFSEGQTKLPGAISQSHSRTLLRRIQPFLATPSTSRWRGKDPEQGVEMTRIVSALT